MDYTDTHCRCSLMGRYDSIFLVISMIYKWLRFSKEIVTIYFIIICRFSAHFWSMTWVLTGKWELNGLKDAYWIMAMLQIIVIWHMEQVSVSLCPITNLLTVHILDSIVVWFKHMTKNWELIYTYWNTRN
jgi:hypothetical protein